MIEPRLLSNLPLEKQWRRYAGQHGHAPTPQYMLEDFRGQPSLVVDLSVLPPPRAQEPESDDEDGELIVKRIEDVFAFESSIDAFKKVTGQDTLPGALLVHAETVAEDPTESAAVQLSSWALLMASDAASMIEEAHEIAQQRNQAQALAVVRSLPGKVEPFVMWAESVHRCDDRFAAAIRWGLRAIDAYAVALHAAMQVFAASAGPQDPQDMARDALKCLVSCKLSLMRAQEQCSKSFFPR